MTEPTSTQQPEWPSEETDALIDDLVGMVDHLQDALVAIAYSRNEIECPSLDYLQGYRDGQEYLAEIAREAIKPPGPGGRRPAADQTKALSVDLRVPNHTDPLTFEEQIELARQMNLITQLPDPPQERAMLPGEWENLQRLAETVRLYRETNDPQTVNESLPTRTRRNGIDYLACSCPVFGR